MVEACDFTCLDRLEILRMNSPRSLKIGASRHKAGSLPCSIHSFFDIHPPDLARASAGSTSGASCASVSWGVSDVAEGTSGLSSSSVFSASSGMAYPLFLLVIFLVLLSRLLLSRLLVLLLPPTHPHRLR